MSYYDNKWLKELKTRIKACEISGQSKGFELEFDDTIFFPGGGGQAKDRGSIEIVKANGDSLVYKLEDVYDREGKTIHVVQASKGFDIGQEVILRLDWDHRIDGMSQHTGQHLLSGCFYSLYRVNTRGLHIGQDVSQLDIEGEFTDEMVMKLEEYANDQIYRAIAIKNYVLEKGESLNTRRPLPTKDEPIRILEIEGLDVNACCGLHLDNTRDLGMVKIKKYYKHKSGTRFEYLAGKRAIDYVLNREGVLDKILNKYSSGEDNILNSLDNIEKKKDEYYARNTYLMDRLIEKDISSYLAEARSNSKGLKLVRVKFEGEEPWYLENLAKSLVAIDDVLVLFANRTGNKYTFNFLTVKKTMLDHQYIDLGKTIKNLAKDHPIKGGGSKFSVSGICDTEKDIDILLDSVYNLYVGVL